jgi:hypothetical protein
MHIHSALSEILRGRRYYFEAVHAFLEIGSGLFVLCDFYALQRILYP